MNTWFIGLGQSENGISTPRCHPVVYLCQNGCITIPCSKSGSIDINKSSVALYNRIYLNIHFSQSEASIPRKVCHQGIHEFFHYDFRILWPRKPLYRSVSIKVTVENFSGCLALRINHHVYVFLAIFGACLG